MPESHRASDDPKGLIGRGARELPAAPSEADGIWPRRARSAWTIVRRPLFLVFVGVAAMLGWVGYAEYMTRLGQHPSASDLSYRVVNLFFLGTASVIPPVPWQLDVARWLAPAIAAYATFRAVRAVLGARWSRLRAGWYSGHVVICGLGPVGARLAASLRSSGHRVVAIERDRSSPRISACRELGVVVLIGDVSDVERLRSARVDRAAYLFAATDEDGVNSEIAIAARELAGENDGSVISRVLSRVRTQRPEVRALTCFVNMHDRTLNAVLKQFAIGRGSDDMFRLESFSVAERAATALLDTPTSLGWRHVAAFGQPHIVIVGSGDMASELIVETGRRWRKQRGGADDRLRLTVVGDRAEERVAALLERHPQLNGNKEHAVASITARSMSLDSAAFMSADFLRDPDGSASATVVYVCVGDDARGLSAGIHIRSRLRRDDIPIVVCTETEQNGVASLLHREVEGEVHAIEVFGMLDCLGDTAVLLRGNNERVAQAIHADYVELESGRGFTREDNASLVPWRELDDVYKESNRRAAADVGRKLRKINCAVEPLLDWDEQLFEFNTDELELLAEMEHERWSEWREATGWRHGQVRDPEKKEHPDMVPYDALLPESRKRDQRQVERIPHFLADLDFKVERRTRTAPDA